MVSIGAGARLGNVIDMAEAPIIVGQSSIAPASPSIARVMQSGSSVLAVVPIPSQTGSAPYAAMNLYRGATGNGPWTKVDGRPLSTLAANLYLYDEDPPQGVASYYVATTVDVNNIESAYSSNVSISPATSS